MKVGFHWNGHVFWNKYVRYLDTIDVGNLQRITLLDKQLGDYQVINNGCDNMYYAKLI